MAAPEPLRTRQAALLLHGLAPALREKVLSRLSAAEVSVLKPLLQELAELGIPKSQASVVECLGEAAAQAPKTAVERAKGLHPDDILRALRGRGVPVVALLLRSAEWPWKTEVLNRLPEPFRTRVLDELNARTAPAPEGVFRVFCECLCRDAAAEPIAQARFLGDVPAGRLTGWML